LIAAFKASDDNNYRGERGDESGERATHDDDSEDDSDGASIASFASAAVPPNFDVNDSGQNESEAIKVLRLILQLVEKQKEAAEREWAIER